ncbi:MAG: hypothetical protein ABII23_06185 [bacterium]
MKKTRLIFIKKLFVYIFLIILSQTAVYYASGDNKLFYPAQIVYSIQLLKRANDIVYMGDSVLLCHNSKDKNKAYIPDMLRNVLKNRKITSIIGIAYQLDVYYAICRYIVSHQYPIKTIIIPINLRAFSTSWAQRPEYQFVKYKAIFKYDNFLFRIFFKPLRVFRAINLTPISQEEYLKLPVYYGNKIAGTVREYSDEKKFEAVTEENMKQKIIFHYMFSLDKKHPQLKSMMRLAKLLKKKNMRMVFYITPVDWQTCSRYIGNDFQMRVKKNIDVISDLLYEQNLSLLDLSFGLPSEAFDWEQNVYPNEHLSERGRMYIAEKLAVQLSEHAF